MALKSLTSGGRCRNPDIASAEEHCFGITFSCITLIKSKCSLSACHFSSAVQSERKPIEVVPREKHANCAASTQKIYIRKDLNSPLIATPTFISDTETDGSRSVEIRATDKAQVWALSISWLLMLTLFQLGFDDALCVQIQPAGPGDAG